MSWNTPILPVVVAAFATGLPVSSRLPPVNSIVEFNGLLIVSPSSPTKRRPSSIVATLRGLPSLPVYWIRSIVGASAIGDLPAFGVTTVFPSFTSTVTSAGAYQLPSLARTAVFSKSAGAFAVEIST